MTHPFTKPEKDGREDLGASQATGLSQAEPEAGLGPSGFDPSRGYVQLPEEPERPFPAWSTRWYERRAPKRFGITKMVRTDNGDGWKDDGRRGDVSFVYAWELPAPYGAGQFPEVGNPISTAWAGHSLFARPTIVEIIRLFPKLILDRRSALNRSILKRHKIARDSDGSPKGGDACGSVHDSAGRQASPESDPS